ncbi:MAG: hypothetical protein PHC62_03305 [Candidatus Izemoplasmatales bacterium]|jgi:flavodoxin|nr:hypothetical protein [Candidatus Izemoplasmatales bacterium]
MGKALVLCYSFEGNTFKIAKAISAALQIDLYEIKPVKDLKSTGFSKFIWGGRQVILQKKPELLPITIDLSIYDTVFLGSPIWVGTFAPTIKTLLEDGLLHDKKIAYFYTHEGGAKNAAEKGKESVEKYNEFIGSIGLLNVMKQVDVCTKEAISWAKHIIDIK